jgi:hypothetical protein
MAFVCSICGEAATQICARCTKDICGNHVCEKCLKCSDCCECEVVLGEPARANHHATPAAAPAPETAAEPQAPVITPAAEPAGSDADPGEGSREPNLGAAG